MADDSRRELKSKQWANPHTKGVYKVFAGGPDENEIVINTTMAGQILSIHRLKDIQPV